MAKKSYGFRKWFESQNLLVRLLLLLIPVVNWVIEVICRWEKYLTKGGFINLLLAILVLFVGLVFGWLDFIWVLIFGHFFLG
ncbi:MAG: hypothetical protein MRZ09_01045 [Coprobacillus sp.]|nr:hypothetical protein [Coprobacillus sp.]MDY4146220.1 hypothetical protein [Bacilli bacterium]CCY07617.1 unknown [Coprobacillus sp. CAG:698]